MADEHQTSAPKRRRGPSPAKTAATRHAIVDAALSVFLELGYSPARMSDVAARAGLGKGTIYLHFTDKAALLSAVFSLVAQRARANRPIMRPRPDESTGDFLRRAIPPILAEFRQSGLSRAILLVASEGSRAPEVAEAYRRIVIDPVLRTVRLYALRAERRGELPAGLLSPQPLLMVAPVVVTSLWNSLFAGPEPLDINAAFQAYVDLLFRPLPGVHGPR